MICGPLSLYRKSAPKISAEVEMKKRTEFNIKISTENVCSFLDVRKDSPMYEEVMEELREMLPIAYGKIKPVALLEFGDLEGYKVEADGKPVKEALYGVLSIGKEMGEWSTKLFAEGDYLRGMLADAIADDYLFQMDTEQTNNVVKLCRERGKGIAGRVEAPQDISMSIQKKAYDATQAEREGIGIRESYMFDPVKTVCQVYLLDENVKRYHPEHDCSKCGNLTCKHRNLPAVQVTLRLGEEERSIRARKSESLLHTFREHDIFLAAVCGGRGTCKKCRVRFLKGATEPSKEDEKCFTKKELADGWRLACRAYPRTDCTVLIEQREEDFFVPADEEERRPDTKSPHDLGEGKPKNGQEQGGLYGIAADIGTTTIAMELVELPGGNVVDVYTAINRQRVYGADVISRIEASNSGKGRELKKSILSDLEKGIRILTKNRQRKISRMVISANTTMVHLLMGYSCEALGVYPFTPVNIHTIHTTGSELFGDAPVEVQEIEITVCPGISTYVGGDITAGLFELEFGNREKPSILIDLGTNGEMAVGNRERILTASTAAGPAFEGGNIVCGTGSIPGAVCGLTIEGEEVHPETIGGVRPAGICGTGVVEAVYEFLKEEIMDETGHMEEPWFGEGFPIAEEGDIRFYQKDVREIQLAKSAVRAGMETLLLKYGITYDEVEHIYIAGGFGCQMDIHKAVGIGLFPAECEEKIKAVGNTSLKGAARYLLDPLAEGETKRIVETAKEVALSDSKEFQEFYMEYMYFGDTEL